MGSAGVDEAVLGVLLKKPCSVFWLFPPVESAFFRAGVRAEGVKATPVFLLAILKNKAATPNRGTAENSLLLSRRSNLRDLESRQNATAKKTELGIWVGLTPARPGPESHPSKQS